MYAPNLERFRSFLKKQGMMIKLNHVKYREKQVNGLTGLVKPLPEKNGI